MKVEILWPNATKSIERIFIKEIQRHFYYREDDYPYIVLNPFIIIERKGTKFDMLLEAEEEMRNRWNGTAQNVKIRIIPEPKENHD